MKSLLEDLSSFKRDNGEVLPYQKIFNNIKYSFHQHPQDKDSFKYLKKATKESNKQPLKNVTYESTYR